MWFLTYALLTFCLHIQFSSEVPQAQETYRAGVVEFGVHFNANADLFFESNTRRYLEVIQEAATKNTDILVFSESTLNYGFTADREIIVKYAMYIPDPDDRISPCDVSDIHEILKTISCAARDGRLYIVINVSEKLQCNDYTQADMDDHRPCASDGYYFFNTNVVFDRYGTIVSRYRKTHLFGEVAFNTTAKAEIETFGTDFGVKFGHLICFDLQYESPAQILIRKGVQNFVLPLMWYSELPFLTAVQYEEAWAYSSNANLLAAGASSPLSGSGGSGIFAGRHGARVSLLAGITTTKLLIADVFKRPADSQFPVPGVTISESPRRMNMLRDHLDMYSIKMLDPDTLTNGKTERICYGDFCCDFDIRVSLIDDNADATHRYHYALLAFRGVRTYSGVANGGVENCGIVACLNRNNSTCGLRFPHSTEYISPYVIFENITLTGNFTLERSAQYPTTLTGAMLPLPTDQYSSENWAIKNKHQLTVQLTARQEDLLTFGVFGRIFGIDNEPETKNRDEWRKVLDIELSRTGLEQVDFYTNSGEGLFEYVWSTLRIPLVFLVIYVLEMM